MRESYKSSTNESDSVKSARKAKISCTRPVKERQKFVSELCIAGTKQNAHGKHERVTRQ